MFIFNIKYQYRAYVTEEQKALIEKTFNCCRWVWNDALSSIVEAHKFGFYLDYLWTSRTLTMLKKTTHKWLKEPDKWALANTLRDLEKQRKRDYKEKKRFPKYKVKKHIQSYRTTQSNNSIEIKSINGKNGRLKLPKLGWVKIRLSRIPAGRILNATVTRNKSGKYFISQCCEILPIQVNKTNF